MSAADVVVNMQPVAEGEYSTPPRGRRFDVDPFELTREGHQRIARCNREVVEIRSFEGPCWFKAMGEADWEVERFLIEAEAAKSAGGTLVLSESEGE